MMITKSKPSQQLGAAPLDPCNWDLLIGIGTPPKKFLPTPLQYADDTTVICTGATPTDVQNIMCSQLSLIQQWKQMNINF